MAEATDTLGIIFQNLEDAGCDEQTAKKCMAFAESGDMGGMLPILTRYRSELFGTVRSGQKQIDCLDYLIYKIRKGTIQEEK
ncbi:hypothetical protein LQE92_03780 [Lacrimispora sp. NSJ-141]|uniref:Uncharacterized protein n=1 Tax=Lientehia hominis TaxID=2897778 RepID=A0AAP2RGD0_9FIRM|nr:hypothetical protein [Lientehia hominis]MCD2491744.1 hypothetical protein [Lientehia hominis]